MGALVEQAHASFGEEARRRGIGYDLEDDPDAPTIVTDGDRVLQVITNLLANAFRWTPDGGTVVTRFGDPERGRARRRPRTPARASSPTSRSASSSPSSRATTTAQGSVSRSHASLPTRSAARSSSIRRSAVGAASGSSCRRRGPEAASRATIARWSSLPGERTSPSCRRDGPLSRRQSWRCGRGSGQEPAALRRDHLRRPARRPQPLARGLGCVRRLLRRVQRRVPLNDVRDAAADRLIPSSAGGRSRAASCAARRHGARLRARLGSGRDRGAARSGSASLACLLGFVVLQGAYTLRLKHMVSRRRGRDRGTVRDPRRRRAPIAVDVRISPWLLVCTGLLALFLALGKRRAELVLVGAEATPGRRVLDGLLARARRPAARRRSPARRWSRTRCTALTARDSYALVVTMPFVVFGLSRYLHLLHRRGAGEEPENVLLGDVPILATVAIWAVVRAARSSSRAHNWAETPHGVMRLGRSCDVIVQRQDLGGRAALDPLEPPVDALPARRDQIDEQGQVVQACVCARRSGPARAARAARSHC